MARPQAPASGNISIDEEAPPAGAAKMIGKDAGVAGAVRGASSAAARSTPRGHDSPRTGLPPFRPEPCGGWGCNRVFSELEEVPRPPEGLRDGVSNIDGDCAILIGLAGEIGVVDVTVAGAPIVEEHSVDRDDLLGAGVAT